MLNRLRLKEFRACENQNDAEEIVTDHISSFQEKLVFLSNCGVRFSHIWKDAIYLV